jgi:cephalosporin-C deacetylase-like acetyl esterase
MLEHDFPFDPTCGYDLAGLLAIAPPPEPAGFVETWRARYAEAVAIDPAPQLHASAARRPGFRVLDLAYRSSDDFPIRGWLLLPVAAPPRLGLILGHGYGGIETPDFPLPRADAAYLIPCFRGLFRIVVSSGGSGAAAHGLRGLHLDQRGAVGEGRAARAARMGRPRSQRLLLAAHGAALRLTQQAQPRFGIGT